MTSEQDVNDPSPPASDALYFGSFDETTDYHSRLVMLRAERHDKLKITSVKSRFRVPGEVPDTVKVVQRTDPYFGPKLALRTDGSEYQLTAPGPDSELLLWSRREDCHGQKGAWEKLAEVTARFVEDLPSYEYCPQCDEPIKTLKHELQAEIGCCPNDQRT